MEYLNLSDRFKLIERPSKKCLTASRGGSIDQCAVFFLAADGNYTRYRMSAWWRDAMQLIGILHHAAARLIPQIGD